MSKRFKDAEKHSKGSSVRHKELLRENNDANLRSGQLIECVNPEHWKLGSIHYIQSDCVGINMKTKLLVIEIREGEYRDGVFIEDVSARFGCNAQLPNYFQNDPVGPLVEAFAVPMFHQLQNEMKTRIADSDESWQASEALLKR